MSDWEITGHTRPPASGSDLVDVELVNGNRRATIAVPRSELSAWPLGAVGILTFTDPTARAARKPREAKPIIGANGSAIVDPETNKPYTRQAHYAQHVAEQILVLAKIHKGIADKELERRIKEAASGKVPAGIAKLARLRAKTKRTRQ
jgi:hypothetical protein